MNFNMSTIVLSTLASMVCTMASAGAQSLEVPLQGSLATADGQPYDGAQTIQVSLYAVASGGEALYSETQVVEVEAGLFTLYIGAFAPLDPALFDGGDLWLGVAVGTDAEMTPRLAFGTVPYAAYAKETAAVPAGAVMHFDLDSCPPGWSALEEAAGRTVVGAVSGGTVGEAVGDPLDDGETPSHTHGVALSTTTESADAAHSHSIAHNHGSISNDAHNHQWGGLVQDTGGGAVNTYNASGGTIAVFGRVQIALAISGYAAMVQAAGLSNTNYYTNSDTHSHTVHATSSASGDTSIAHAHEGDVAGVTDTPTSYGGLPYLQLLTCRKD